MKYTKGSRIATGVIIALCAGLAALILIPRMGRARTRAASSSAAPAGGGSAGAPRAAEGRGAGSGGGAGGVPARGVTGGSARAATAVRVREVRRGDIEKYLVINGDVILRTQVSIFPTVSGKLTEVRLVPGEGVLQGQTVGLVDPSRPGEVYSQSPVVSTISGTVLQVLANPGDTVSPQTAVYLVGDPGSLAIETFVPERYATVVRRGQGAQAVFEAMRGERFAAVVDEISPILDPASRTLRIRLRLTGRDGRIKAGMFATVSLVTEAGEGVLVIPREAAINSSGSWIVFVVGSGGVAEQRELRLGLEGEEEVEVVSGVEEGELVVTAGQNFLSAGDLVRVLE